MHGPTPSPALNPTGMARGHAGVRGGQAQMCAWVADGPDGPSNPTMTRYWLHLTCTTYGTWLRGDPRSFRTRHHREHVRGDYKDPPPPGTYAALYEHSQRLMKRAPVRLSEPASALACTTIVETLEQRGARVRVACVDDHHVHVLGTIPISPERMAVPRKDGDAIKAAARHLMGIAKSRSARLLSQASLAPAGPVWTRRTWVTKVRGRDHFFAVERYLLDHASRGAFVWTPSQPH